jgi:hypothetical protein
MENASYACSITRCPFGLRHFSLPAAVLLLIHLRIFRIVLYDARKNWQIFQVISCWINALGKSGTLNQRIKDY